MSDIQDYFKKFDKIFSNFKAKNEIVLKAILKNTGISLSSENFKIQNGKIFLKTNHLQKIEILFKKEEILSDLKKELGKNSPRDIF